MVSQIFLLIATSFCAGEQPNVWLGKTSQWSDGGNWSSGQVPSALHDAIITPDGKASPVLDAGATVHSLTIDKGANLSLNGHRLTIGLPSAIAVNTPGDVNKAGLRVVAGGLLECRRGTPEIVIHAGGFESAGQVNGKPKLTVAGSVSDLAINSERDVEFAVLTTGPSIYPYRISVSGKVTVGGDLTLSGGHVIADAESFIVRGNLVFKGQAQNVALVPRRDIHLYGTIRSEGSAYCIEAPGSTASWVQPEERAVCRLGTGAGWLRMSGRGDQTISPGGVLPPIAIDKPSGSILVDGDLHCNGLLIQKGNTLDLSKGQRLILGHHIREWSTNPELNARPKYGPIRTCRDLVNYGTIKGTPDVPVSFLLNEKGHRYSLHVSYRWSAPTGKNGAPLAGQFSEQLYAGLPEKAPGSLSVNRAGGRLQVIEGKLYIDGKEPVAGEGGENADDELDFDEDLDELPDESGAPAEGSASARIASLKLVAVEYAPFTPPKFFAHNVSALVERICIAPRGPVIWAVNGSEWSDVYDMVDGDAGSGFGGSPFVDLVFPRAVNIGAVRLVSSGSLTTTEGFAASADTSGDGKFDRLLAWVRGSPIPSDSWMNWGEGATRFNATKVHRLRIQAIHPTSKPTASMVNEIEIYTDSESFDALPDGGEQAGSTNASAPLLTYGEEVAIEWPLPVPDNVVHKTASAAMWMFGISGEQWKESPHLRDYPQTGKVLDEMKHRYGFDIVTLFYEGVKGFHWPSVNFRSETNTKYFEARKTALAMQAAMKPATRTEDEFEDVTEEGEDAALDVVPDVKLPASAVKYSSELRIEDLPCQRNLLVELCEEAHKREMKVFVICRPEDVSRAGAYIGPDDVDPYEQFLKECAAAGADGFSLTPDEESLLWSASRNPRWKVFHEEWKQRLEGATPEVRKQFILERARMAGSVMRERMQSVRAIKPDAEFFTSGARMLSGGDPYDIVGHLAEVDYIGCHYQAHITRRWAATSPKRKVKMGEFAHRDVRWPIQSMLQGARLISTYRYNYIELQKSEDHRIRENTFIDQFVRWGGTRPGRPPVALVVSRASERWWPIDCKEERTGSDRTDRAWRSSEILYAFLMKNGYSFDVYYLDQVSDLQALRQYRLAILPFPYSIPNEAGVQLDAAFEAGTNLLICERKGEVDEVGRRHEKPLLQPIVEKGEGNGRVVFLDDDFADREGTRHAFAPLKKTVDALLGKHKVLDLESGGNRIEAVVHSVDAAEHYVTLINWNRLGKNARFSIGLNLPAGSYKMLSLSSDTPKVFRRAVIDDQLTFDAESLRQFSIELKSGEVQSLYVVPESQGWTKR